MITSIGELFARIRSLFRKTDLDRDFNSELDGYLEMAIEENKQRGMSAEEARRQALLRLGGKEQAREQHRDARGLPGLEAFWQDARYAFRTLRKDAGFTTIAILILALGIGVNTAVFSVINTVLLRPLPFPQAHQLVRMTRTDEKSGLSGITYRVIVLEEFRKRNQSFQQLAAYFPFFGEGDYTLRSNGEPERISGVPVTQNFFQTLGVQPALGRLFTNEECQLNGRKAALLSHAFWQKRFGGDPSIVGQTLPLNNQPVTIVGVLPATFDFSSIFAPGTRIDVVTPAVFDEMRNWGNVFSIIGRLKPGFTVQKASAEFETLVPAIMQDHPDWWGVDAKLTGLKEFITGKLRRSLIVLWSAVGLVLLIVCVNLSNLLIARTATRQKEFAVRGALGAGRGRLIRQLFTESLLLSSAGALLGLILAYLMTDLIARSGSVAIPLLSTIRIDGAALAFTILIAVVTGLLFGVAPGLRMAGIDLQNALKDSGRGFSGNRSHGRMRAALVIGEVALACVLLTGAGLLLRSFLRLLDVDLGYQPSQATALRVDYVDKSAIRVDKNDKSGPERRTAFFREIVRRVKEVPGVESAGISDILPLDRNRSWGVRAKGKTYREGESPDAFVYVVDSNYLQTMGIPLVAGRRIEPHDTTQSQPVAVINESAARRLWPEEDALGKIATMGDDQERQVVGIVRDVRHTGLDEASGSEMYMPISQVGPVGAELVIRSALPPKVLAVSVRQALRAFDPTLPATDFRPLQQFVDRSVSPRRFLMTLVGGFAGLALVLATLGIYGVISYSVTQRTQEIGVRMALGATPGSVQMGVVRGTLRLAGIGIALGAIASFLGARLLTSLLFGVEPGDPATFAAMAALMSAVALVAGYLPSLRASRIDPMVALRAE